MKSGNLIKDLQNKKTHNLRERKHILFVMGNSVTTSMLSDEKMKSMEHIQISYRVSKTQKKKAAV